MKFQIVLAISFCCAFITPALSQIVRAVFVESAPRLDGRMDEPVWQDAAIVTQFQQREPEPGAPASEKTIVHICYDKNHIYFGFTCHENPDKITAKQIARDAVLADEDKVVIILDTFLDGRNAYWFEINARGSMGDALLSENGAVMNKEWDGIWDARSAIYATGWATEVVIPFKSLNFHPSRSTWGLKLVRDIQYKSEFLYWPVANVNTFKYQVSDAGRLADMTGMSQGLGLDFRPYGLTRMKQKRERNLSYEADVGFDLFYQLSPALKSVLTVNTDFAQTEVDDRQVNLTRFALFFPEKRDFFLDGSNYFKFAIEGADNNAKSRQLIPFFSRRIGLSENGSPIPILGGVKITGQSGAWNLGFLDVLDQRDTGKQNFAVLRASRNFGAQSAIGLIGTFGNAVFSRQNSLIGADIKLATSKIGGDKNLVYYLYGLKSTTDSLSGQDAAFGSEISYPNDFFSCRIGYLQIEKNFVAGVGFVPRANIRNSYGSIRLAPRPNRWRILQIQIESDFDYITDLSNRLLTREVTFEPLSVRFLSGDNIAFEWEHQYELLDADFNIFGDHFIPTGTHEFLRKEVRLSSARRRRLWGELDYEWGDFWNGTGTQIQFASGYKISVPVSVELAYERNDINLPQGAFVVNVYRLNVDLLFSPRVTFKTYIQYDDETRTFGWQSRFRWILQPGNEILLVWNSLWDPLEKMEPHLRDFSLAQSTAGLKINCNYRF